MPFTIDKIMDIFPFPTITPIVRSPTYETISELHMKLNSNAASMQSNLENDAIGLLYTTVSLTVYTTLLAKPFVVPVNPGSEPIIPDGSTVSAIAHLRYFFKLANEFFTKYDRTDKALLKILLSAVNKLSVRLFFHHYIGYGRTTTRQILNQLYAIYGNILPAELQLKDTKLRTPTAPTTPPKHSIIR